ncbi:MAG: hypothetical protein IPQ25_12860 [Chitinophagaceae bacterium]|nr:hypothetical protein [Chitinophagaceae bacterium]
MEQTNKNDKLLAHWTYARDEWNRYLKWSFFKKGFIFYLFHLLNPFKQKGSAEVKISSRCISINENRSEVNFPDQYFADVDIYEAGNLNILEILYKNGHHRRKISIPVPKGKLKEAIDVQMRLTRQYTKAIVADR